MSAPRLKASSPQIPKDLRKLIPGMPLPGGIFAGLVYPSGIAQALILGPEYDGELTWNAAMKWVASLTFDGATGFYLPARPEGSLCQANLPKEFKPTRYWLGEQHASYSYSAWGQGFSDGYQNYWYEDDGLRARAVRRLAI